MSHPVVRLLSTVPLFLAFSPPAMAGDPGAPPQGLQTAAHFAASYVVMAVSNISATAQKVSCYSPELTYFGALSDNHGYLDNGMSTCRGQATTGEDLGPYPTQNVANPPMRVKDHSESDLRYDPNDVNHLIGQSKW